MELTKTRMSLHSNNQLNDSNIKVVRCENKSVLFALIRPTMFIFCVCFQNYTHKEATNMSKIDLFLVLFPAWYS